MMKNQGNNNQFNQMGNFNQGNKFNNQGNQGNQSQNELATSTPWDGTGQVPGSASQAAGLGAYAGIMGDAAPKPGDNMEGKPGPHGEDPPTGRWRFVPVNKNGMKGPKQWRWRKYTEKDLSRQNALRMKGQDPYDHGQKKKEFGQE